MMKRILLFIITNYSQVYERRYFNLIHKLNRASYILIYLITSYYHAAIVKLFYVNVLSYEYSVYYMYEGNEINCHPKVIFNFCVMSSCSFVTNYGGFGKYIYSWVVGFSFLIKYLLLVTYYYISITYHD